LAEALEILTSMFSGGRTTFEGVHYQAHDVPNLPPPVQSPRPPIHVGGIGMRYTIPLVARFADVWNVPTYGLGTWEQVVPTLDAECEKVGRDPASLRRSLEAVLVLAPDEATLTAARGLAERRYRGPGWGLAEGGFIGTPSAVVDRIGEQIDKGVTMFVFFLHDRGESDTLHLLAEEVLPHFS
jgi:alkanesulfonate monooxygenase SsuD/methylene tetrahydromethanopterin reductase-like flavin-dependent oxidoreductase (luciferase family)